MFRGKPIKFGYKIWILAGADGYPYMNLLYGGRQQNTNATEPLGARVVTSLIKPILDYSDPLKHYLYFDNFFTSYQLLVDLLEKNIKATGTIRPNRTQGAAKVLVTNKELSKRGEFDYRCDGKVFVAKWNDSAVVHVASNCVTHEPLQVAKRRVNRNVLDVKQPFLVKRYNIGMGGVDLLDRLLGAFRPVIRGKKWWFPLFLNALNMSVVAAWRMYCHLHPNHRDTTHLEFRRSVSLCLLKGTPNRKRYGGGLHAHLPYDVRYDGIGHKTATTSQGRCVLCSANTRTMCSKCGVRLHYSRGSVCFTVYHTRP